MILHLLRISRGHGRQGCAWKREAKSSTGSAPKCKSVTLEAQAPAE